MSDYDVVTVGGGLGGSALALAMARGGARVLVLEREERFQDRVRGEVMMPWGVAEARALGIDTLLRDSCGNELPFLEMGAGPRDLRATTPQGLPALGFSHPDAQEALLDAAADAGAVVRRGVTVEAVRGGRSPAVTVGTDGSREDVRARLVVATDGRGSLARRWGGFTVARMPNPFLIAGVLLEGVRAREDVAHVLFRPCGGMAATTAHVGRGKFRSYLVYPLEGAPRLQRLEELPRFLAGAAVAWPPFAQAYADVKAAGPLASFACDDDWVEHPYRKGIALLGDAAATSDPAFAQGLSLTLRDARVLSERLLAGDDWDEAGNAYAEEHDRMLASCHDATRWFRSMFLETGPEADARRARALPLIAADPSRVPDHLISGPDLPTDDSVRARFFAEDVAVTEASVAAPPA